MERRRVQRVQLPQPLAATAGSTRVFIVDVSLRGLRLLHQDDIGAVGAACVVRAEWDGRPMELQCTIVRTMRSATPGRSGRTQYHSGLAITRVAGVSSITLRRLIEHHIERALDEQKANARGVPPPLAAQSVQTGAPAAFVRHELAMGRWREVMTPSTAQPEHGFTIAARTTPAEVEMLRRAYENAENASLIRRLAAMSISGAEIVQARRYMP